MLPRARYIVPNFSLKASVLAYPIIYRNVRFNQTETLAAATTDGKSNSKNEPRDSTLEKLSKNKGESFLPWYVTLANNELKMNKQFLNSDTKNKGATIKYPASSPEELRNICQFLQEQLDMQDILIFDMKDRGNEIKSVGSNSDIMVLATAKSSRHCTKAAQLIREYLKHNFEVIPKAEGLINKEIRKKELKRLLRKPGSVSSKNIKTGVKDEDWVLIDSKIKNIFINLFTENRRKHLNLEHLYASENEKCMYERDANEVTGMDKSSSINFISPNDNILSGLRRLANQNRRYSTSATSHHVTDTKYDFIQHLSNQKYQDIKNIFANNKSTDNDKNMKILEDFKQDLSLIDSTMPISSQALVTFLDNYFPPSKFENSETYWTIRRDIICLLATRVSGLKPLTFYEKHSFLYKSANSGKLTSEDLLEYFKLTSYVIENRKKKLLNTPRQGLLNNTLVLINQITGNILFNYQQVSDIKSALSNEEVGLLLVHSMYVNSEFKLRTIHNTIATLLHLVKTKPSSTLIIEILEVLKEIESWPHFFKVWNSLAPKYIETPDKRPWGDFVRIITASNNKQMMYEVASEQLLWFKRYKNNISSFPGFEKNVKKLYQSLDPNDMHLVEIKEYILSK